MFSQLKKGCYDLIAKMAPSVPSTSQAREKTSRGHPGPFWDHNPEMTSFFLFTLFTKRLQMEIGRTIYVHAYFINCQRSRQAAVSFEVA
jgi:hypothetical protein